jgi:hypothetical protein
MGRLHSHVCGMIACVGVLTAYACGGGGSGKGPQKPIAKKGSADKPNPPPETEEDREKKRHDAALAIVPENSTCLPASLKTSNAAQLQLAAVDGQPRVCAIDADKSRLLGAIACWQVDLSSGALEYKPPAPLPGRSVGVLLTDRCARGYCIPKDAKISGEVAHMAWSPDGSKVAVVAGDDLHLFDAKKKEHDISFSIHADKGVPQDASVTAIDWVAGNLFITANDAVYVFKLDGTAVGPIEPLGGGKDAKPISTRGGSFVVFDDKRVAVAEQGYSSVTVYEVDNGKRTKLARKISNGPCKKEELAGYWQEDLDKVGAKCKDHMSKMFGHLVGADAVAGSKNLLVLLRGPRLGEFAILDPKTLTEKKAIKMPWCAEMAGGATGGGDDAADDKEAPKAEKAKPKKAAPPKASKRAGKESPKDSKDEDPEAGGQ